MHPWNFIFAAILLSVIISCGQANHQAEPVLSQPSFEPPPRMFSNQSAALDIGCDFDSPHYVSFSHKQKELWWYQDKNGIPLGHVRGRNRIVVGVGSGAWGYWGFIAAVPDVDIVESNSWVARNVCREDEIGIGSAGEQTFRLRCAKLMSGFSHADKSNHYARWGYHLSSPCPRNKALIGHIHGPQNYRIGYTCARIKKP